MNQIEKSKEIFIRCILNNKYIPHKPFAKQAELLIFNGKEAGYGGAAGGGKSDYLLMEALKFVDLPGYRALIVRRTYSDLSKAGAIMNRLQEWLAPFVSSGEVHWNSNDYRFTFPSGATVEFGHVQFEKDKLKYQGAEYHYIGVDEATHFTETMYTYLFSRLRKTIDFPVPVRIRSATNPGGIGHDWYYKRFIIGDKHFLASKVDDNPYLDEDYKDSLNSLDLVTRAQLKDGNWEIRPGGNMFKSEWFSEIILNLSRNKDIEIADDLRSRIVKTIRFWDLAATEFTGKNDPDYTVGTLVSITSDNYILVNNMVRFRESPAETKRLIKKTVESDGREIEQIFERQPAAAGKYFEDEIARSLLGYITRFIPALKGNIKGNGKIDGARPLSNAFENGLVYLFDTKKYEINDLVNELVIFPQKGSGIHDDIVDSLKGAFNYLMKDVYGEEKIQVLNIPGFR